MSEKPKPEGFDWKPNNSPLGPDPREHDNPLRSGEREAFAEIESRLAGDSAIPSAPGQGRQEDIIADDKKRPPFPPEDEWGTPGAEPKA